MNTQRTWSWSAALVSAALALSPALEASAQAAAGGDDERARGHFLAGRSYFDQGRYDDAAEQFMESYALSQRTELLLNTASSYERGLRHEDAARTLELYLQRVPDSPDRHTLEERIRRIRELAGRGGGAGAAANEPAESPGSARPASDDGLGTLGITGIVVGGLGVALGVVTIATGIVALDLHSSLADRCGAGGTTCPPGSQADIDLGNALSVTSTALMPISLVAIGVGVVLLALDLTDGSGSGDVAVIGGPGELGLGLSAAY